MKTAIVAFIFFLLSSMLLSQTVNVQALSSSWSLAIGEGNLTAGAGSNLVSTYDSVTNQLVIDVTTSDEKKVYVALQDSLPAGISVSLKRNSDGTGGGTISGGTSYTTALPVQPDLPLEFFTLSADRTGIQVGIRVSGISLSNPPNIYNTKIIFTIAD